MAEQTKPRKLSKREILTHAVANRAKDVHSYAPDRWEALNNAKKKLLDAWAAEVAEARALSERLLQEAQIHALEARTANATIAEIYQAVSGATGEPGNWHGAAPVVEELTRLRAIVDAFTPPAKMLCAMYEGCQEQPKGCSDASWKIITDARAALAGNP
jgi:hypothetical protein